MQETGFQKATKPPKRMKYVRRPWYGDPEIMATYGVKRQPAPLPQEENHDGLYYNRTNWRSYVNDVMETASANGNTLRPDDEDVWELVPVEYVRNEPKGYDGAPMKLETARAYATPDFLR